MNKDSLLENLSIYNDNLSIYYLASVFITVLSVGLAWWYHNNVVKKEEPLQSKNEKSDSDLKEPLFQVSLTFFTVVMNCNLKIRFQRRLIHRFVSCGQKLYR